MSRLCIPLLALAGLVVTTPASAYRPFDSTDADVAGYGELELEMGPAQILRTHDINHFDPIEVLNLGFAHDWELVLQGTESVPSATPASARIALADTGVFVKHVWREGSLQEKSGLSVATEAGFTLPGIQEEGETGVGFSVDLILSQRYSFGTFHLNLQGAKSRDGNLDLFAGFIGEGPFQWRVRPVVELLGDREFSDHTTTSVLGGAIWRVTDGFDLDVGLRLAEADHAGLYEIRAGFSWALPLWH